MTKPAKRKYMEYNHHGNVVGVRTDLKGRHREYCLCFSCAKFKLNAFPQEKCSLANKLYQFCIRNKMVTPVWECPEFEEKI